ncbi:MAG TPA: hypothetical protein VLX12_09940 [Syntrophorhabdales bacterium]|nr:hypothetical protein [Syntrophorhabdales bacterium]
MHVSDDMKNVLDVTAKILIRCFFMNFALILFWWCFFMIGRGEFRTLIFNITAHEFALATYCGIAFAKVCNIMFFLFPYIAIRWLLKVRRS